jgi:hypothetical protein
VHLFLVFQNSQESIFIFGLTDGFETLAVETFYFRQANRTSLGALFQQLPMWLIEPLISTVCTSRHTYECSRQSAEQGDGGNLYGICNNRAHRQNDAR